MLKLSAQYRPELVETRRLRADLEPMLGDSGITSSRIDDLMLVLTEAFTNIVRHASPPAASIDLEIRLEAGDLTIALRDDGSRFDGFEAARERARGLGDLSMMENGMGLNLIFSLASSVTYSSTAEGNILMIREPRAVVERKSILAIDDDPVGLRLVEAFLSDQYTVHAFRKGEDALAHIEREQPDLIISDIDMPDLNGLQFREALRSNPATALIPFIFLSGLRDEDIQDEANELDIDDFLEKPIGKGKLVRTVDRVLKRSARIRQSAAEAFETSFTNSLRASLPDTRGNLRFFEKEVAASAGGGDFMVHADGEDFLTVLLLDVMGHGVPAKLFAHAYAGYAQSIMSVDEIARDPALILQKLSDHVARDSRLASTIVTAIAATFTIDGKVTVASAGHPRPLVYLQGTGWRPLPVSGILPGLSDELPETKAVQLGRGDAILLFTDGLGEALCRERPEDALLDTLNRSGAPNSGTLGALFEATESESSGRGHTPDDKSTLLAVAE